jgi:hypothetical protein
MTRAKGSSAVRCDIKVATSGWALSVLFRFFFAGFVFLGMAARFYNKICANLGSTHDMRMHPV